MFQSRQKVRNSEWNTSHWNFALVHWLYIIYRCNDNSIASYFRQGTELGPKVLIYLQVLRTNRYGKIKCWFFSGRWLLCAKASVTDIYIRLSNKYWKKLTWLGFKLKIKGSLVSTVSNGARTLLIFALRIQLHSW